MQIDFKGTNYEIPADVQELAQKRVATLAKFLGADAAQARAYVDMGREAGAQQHGNVWYVDITLDVPGARHYTKEVQDTIEKALDKAVRELSRTVRKARDKERSLVRKGKGLIKSLLRRD